MVCPRFPRFPKRKPGLPGFFTPQGFNVKFAQRFVCPFTHKRSALRGLCFGVRRHVAAYIDAQSCLRTP